LISILYQDKEALSLKWVCYYWYRNVTKW